MGKKGSWFSALKRVFVHSSKEKQVNEFESKHSKETKKKVRGLRHGESKSFMPMFREPSSIEEILGEVDEQKLLIRPLTPFEPPITPSFKTPRAAPQKSDSTRITSPRITSPRITSPRAAPQKSDSTRVTSPRAASIRVPSPRASSVQVVSPKASSSRDVNRHKEIIRHRPEPTLQYRHQSATKIQAAYRGYVARRSFRALRGLVRLQRVVRGQNVKRQTGNAMKMMQLLVRIQTQIQSRRIQMLENQVFQRQSYKFDMELGSTLGNWDISQSEARNQGDWDHSTLTKEEREARIEKKMEAVLKREKAMAYAYSHQSLKSNPKSAQSPVPDVRSSVFPWWQNWNPPKNQAVKTSNITLPRRTPEPKPSPRSHSTYKSPYHTAFDYYESTTPTSTRSMIPPRSKHFMPKTPPSHNTFKSPKAKPGRASSVFEMGLKDDDSLTSCPPYLAPNYMTPTASAKAKARASSNPRERFPGTPGKDSKRRFSFPLTPNIGSFKWNKGSSKKDSDLKKFSEKEQPFQFADYCSDSAVSMPATAGRKPFNRFV